MGPIIWAEAAASTGPAAGKEHLAFWADVLVAFHFAFVAFVAGGLLLIWLGLALRWRWARNFWFRSIHLGCILVVAIEAAFKYQCPLTTWENQLREAAGQSVYGESFVGRLLNEILFSQSYNPDLVHKIHMAVGGLVLLTFVLFPPRFRRKLQPVAPPDPQPVPQPDPQPGPTPATNPS